MVGHSYIVYAPLLYGCTTVLYEGKPVGTPDAGAFWRVISQHKVSALFTAPTAFRAIKREDPEGKLIKNYDLSGLPHAVPGRRALRSRDARMGRAASEGAGHRSLVADRDRLGHLRQLHGHRGSAGEARLADQAGAGLGRAGARRKGSDVKPGDIGALVCKLPLPPGSFPTLWNADERYVQSYLSDYPGYYKTGDAGYIDEDGYVYVMARTDDVINVAGHRLSTGAMEEVLAAHPDVAECAVIGVADELKGQVPLGFLVLKAGVTAGRRHICKEVVQMVRDRIGPVAAFSTATVVKRLPKTRSGKILRGTMQKIADGQDYKMPATIDDPAILGEITESLRAIGYAHHHEQT